MQSSKEQYRKICDEHKDLPVFLQYWWMDAVCNSWDVAVTKKGEHIAGIWPYQQLSKIGVPLMRNPALTPYSGPFIFYPGDIKTSNRDSYEHETLCALITQLPFCKVWNVSFYPGFRQAGILKHEGLQLSVQQTFLIDLSLPETDIFANLKENLRRNIKKAEKELTIVNEPGYIDGLYQAQKHTLNNKGVLQPHTMQQMQRLMDACTQHSAGALWTAKKGDIILAAVWNVWDGERSYYFMGAQNPGSDNYQAISLLLWHCIKEAKNRGNKYFDLEGSMDPGVERFFRGFGGSRELYVVAKKNISIVWKLKSVFKG